MSHSKFNHRVLVSALTLAMLTACGGQEQAPEAAAPAPAPAPEKPAFVSKVAHGSTVDVAVAGIETQQPLVLADGASAGGEVAAPSDGNIVGISVMVGNYANAATGPLEVRVCVVDRCSTGSVDTATSIDNEMLELSLAPPVAVAAGEVVTYTFSRPAGANPLVLWTYGAATGTDHLVPPADATRSPKLSLLLQ